MLLLNVPKGALQNAVVNTAVRRLVSHTASPCKDDSSKVHGEESQQPNQIPYHQKMKYPEKSYEPQVFPPFEVSMEHPFQRVKNSMSYDFEKAKAMLNPNNNKYIPKVPKATDILIVGGGITGSAFASQILERTGSGVDITILETDLPTTSTSLCVEQNGIHQQHMLAPLLDMSLYAAEFYRKLGISFSSPDLRRDVDIGFMPNSSLKLVTENDASTLQDLSILYKEAGWNHQIQSPAMLKEKFPWLNVDGIALSCQGMQKEGWFNKMNALLALRGQAEKNKTKFVQGQLIGFDFVDMTDFHSGPDEYSEFFIPRQAVIQTPSGEIKTIHFGYIFLAAGASVHKIIDMLAKKVGTVMRPPVKIQKVSSFELYCPNGPNIDMPMLIEPNGLKIRRTDFANSYVVWDDTNCEDFEDSENLEASSNYFYEKMYPQLLRRIPSLKDAKLISSYAGLIEKCFWDETLLCGVLPPFHNVLIASGFGNDEFLFSPAVGRALAELITEGQNETLDISCFRLERIARDIRLNEILTM